MMHEQLKNVLFRIVSLKFPDEVEEYEAYADGFIQLYLNRKVYPGTAGVVHSEFGEADDPIPVSSISLLIGTVQLLLELEERKKGRDKRAIQPILERWELHLTRSGLDNEMAKVISAEHGDELRELLFYGG